MENKKGVSQKRPYFVVGFFDEHCVIWTEEGWNFAGMECPRKIARGFKSERAAALFILGASPSITYLKVHYIGDCTKDCVNNKGD